MNVQIFKTNVSNQYSAQMLIEILSVAFPDCQINFDLDDCDNVLRIANQSGDINTHAIEQHVISAGYTCEVIFD